MDILAHIAGLVQPTNKRKRNKAFPILHLAPLTTTTVELLHYMHDHRLINVKSIRCKFKYKDGRECDHILQLKRSNRYKLDGHELTCKVHGGEVSVRTGSWFASRHMCLTMQLYIFHQLKVTTTVKAIVGFFEEVKLNRNTVASMLHNLQERMWLKLLTIKPVFTPHDEIELNEMWLNWKLPEERVGVDARAKEWVEGRWIIGIIDRAKKKLWIECIPNRKRDSIRKVIDPMLQSWLLRWPRIYTDALKSYDYLKHQNTHYVINKDQDGFVVKERTFWGHTVNVHVNNIENLWMQLRKHLRIRHAYNSRQFIYLHIAEFMYNWYKLDWLDLIAIP